MHLPDYEVRSFQSYQNTTVDQGIGVALEPFTDSEKIMRYFGTDLRDIDVLPVFVFVENRRSKSFLLSTERIELVSEADDLAQISSPGGTKSQTPSVTLGAVGAIGLSIPFILASAKLGSDAKEVNHNLVVKALRNKTLSPGADARGFVYFSLPKTHEALQQLRVRMSITDGPGGIEQTIEMPLTARR